ncbi:unnamed protein product [Arabidopsis thaliana]|uniref:(thale cress) hypothetical protein n=1 Tax=Arabidopsis thaliana TaxID=3702 RepID=A0A7G2FCB0_ARATH|nr:unnamed protein product [Arabidopsis thaliana]
MHGVFNIYSSLAFVELPLPIAFVFFFATNPEQQQFEFQHFPISYLRLAAHRVANHYGLAKAVQESENGKSECTKVSIKTRPSKGSGYGAREQDKKRGPLRSVYRRNVSLSRDDKQVSKNACVEVKKNLSLRESGPTSRVAIFRDREKDRSFSCVRMVDDELTKMICDRFDLRPWIDWMENRFVLGDYTDIEKMHLAHGFIEGDALDFIRDVKSVMPYPSWNAMKESLLSAFGIDDDPERISLILERERRWEELQQSNRNRWTWNATLTQTHKYQNRRKKVANQRREGDV